MSNPSKFLALLLSVVLIDTAHAHPGRTDASGGHHDRKNGGYHYHNGGRSSSSSGLRTTARVTAPTMPRIAARTSIRSTAKSSASSQIAPAKPSAQTAFASAKDAYELAVAGLKKIKTDYPGSDEARQAEELLVSYCQTEKASADSKREREAESKLRLAKAFFDRGKTSDGIRWLKDIVTAYEETEAGKEAAQLLKMWTE